MAEILGLDDKHFKLSDKEVKFTELSMDELFSLKKEVIRLLGESERKFFESTIEYKHEYNSAMVYTDWSELDGKVTDTVKKSYCSEQSNTEKLVMKEYEADVNLLQNTLDLINDVLEFQLRDGETG